jgi:hypothetical protein
VVWEIALVVWIVGLPIGVFAASELVHRRRQSARRAVARMGPPAQVIRLAPRARPAVDRVGAAAPPQRAVSARRR